MNHKISIGICTYKRPELLENCLSSVNTAELPGNADISIVIADNDPAGSGLNTVEYFRKKTQIPVYYELETKRGIPFARNNILRQAEKIKTDILAFIDDDEYVDPLWLLRLYEYYQTSGYDVVRGYVRTVYPPETPEWIVKGNIYQRKNRQTGIILDSAATGNVLFNFKKICIDLGLEFDESFGLRGGEDSDFFRRAYLMGVSITWVSDSVVYETLEEERFKISYLLKRKFRTRNGKLFFKNISFFRWIKTFLSSLYRIFKGILLFPVGLIKGFHHSVSALGEIAAGAGRLLGLFHIHPGWDEYDQKE